MLGQTYDLAGPEEYTHREVVEYVFDTIRAGRPEVVNIAPAHSLLYCSRRHADRKNWSASSTHQSTHPSERGRANEASSLANPTGRAGTSAPNACATSGRNYRHKRERSAVAFSLHPVAGRAREHGASLWLLLCTRARAQQRTRGQGHVAPEDNARPDAAAPPGRLGSCRWMGAARTPKNVQMMRKRKAAGLSSETTTKFS